MLVVRLLALALCVSPVACSTKSTDPPRETVFPVSGTITMRGAPVFEVRVTARLVGANPEDGRQFDTLTDEKGEYRFSTYADADGLPPGKYEIRLTWPDVVRRSDPSREADRLNGRYNVAKRPTFLIEVKDAAVVAPPFDIK